MDEDEKEIGFGWAEALAAALSGLAGTDFTGQLAERIDAQDRRKQRREEWDDERAYRDSRDAEDQKRYQTELAMMLAPIIGGMHADNPEASVPMSPLTASAGGAVGVALDPMASATTVQGAPQGAVDMLRQLNLSPEAASGAMSMGMGLGRGEVVRRDREREEAREDLVWETKAVDMVRNGFTPDETEDSAYWDWKKKQRQWSDEQIQLDMQATRAQIAAANRSNRDETPEDMAGALREARDAITARYQVLRNQVPEDQPNDAVSLWYQAADETAAEFTDPGARTVIFQAREIVAGNMRRRIGSGEPAAPTRPARGVGFDGNRTVGAMLRDALEGLPESGPTYNPLDPANR